METKTNVIIVGVVFVLVGLGLGYFWGGKNGYDQGYQKATADIQATQAEVAEKAAGEAAKVANPFQSTNPLEGVSANPFKDAAKKLNPFAQ